MCDLLCHGSQRRGRTGSLSVGRAGSWVNKDTHRMENGVTYKVTGDVVIGPDRNGNGGNGAGASTGTANG